MVRYSYHVEFTMFRQKNMHLENRENRGIVQNYNPKIIILEIREFAKYRSLFNFEYKV